MVDFFSATRMDRGSGLSAGRQEPGRQDAPSSRCRCDLLRFEAIQLDLEWYLGQAAPNSTYGAAGALIVLMFWVYYSAQIFRFGAELTKAIDDARNGALGTIQ